MKAIIFDYDGVIVDGDMPRFTFLKQAFAKYGVTLPESMFSATIGRTTKDVFATVLDPSVSDEIRQKVFDEFLVYKSEIVAHVLPMDTTVSFIKEYTGDIQFVIASNSSGNFIKSVLQRFGILDKFAHIISKDMVERPKPDPDIYLKALATVGLDAKDCIVIEDSLVGIKAAMGANISQYVFLNPYNNKETFQSLPVRGFIQTIDDYRKLVA